jgi:hypothetical protein
MSKYPMGKLDDTDEGQIALGVSSNKRTGVIKIHFGKEVSWIGLYPSQVRELADLLLKHAVAVEGNAQ